jgi:thiamine-phosphate pyrophosphorylase
MNRIAGLYAITPDNFDSVLLLKHTEFALDGGASAIQYRNKTANETLKRDRAQVLLQACRRRGAWLIINDDVMLAKQIDADGVHLGKNDVSIETARDVLGPGKIIGVSCYGYLRCALDAQRRGANYVAFGSVYASPTKPLAKRAPLSLLSEAKQRLKIPIVAIGGITVDNVADVINAGADAIAVSSGLFASEDVKGTATRFNQAFATSGHVEQSAIIRSI